MQGSCSDRGILISNIPSKKIVLNVVTFTGFFLQEADPRRVRIAAGHQLPRTLPTHAQAAAEVSTEFRFPNFLLHLLQFFIKKIQTPRGRQEWSQQSPNSQRELLRPLRRVMDGSGGFADGVRSSVSLINTFL